MKTKLLIPMLLLVTIQALKAQSDSIILQKFYHTWIIPEKGSKGKSGVLYQIKDSSVLVSNSPNRQHYYLILTLISQYYAVFYLYRLSMH